MIVTFDLGTTRLKVAAFNLSGDLLGQVAIRNRDYRSDNQQWQSADDWWDNCQHGFQQLTRSIDADPRDVTAFSVSGRAGAAVFVDNEGAVIKQPWSDQRHQPELRQLQANYELPLYAATLIAKYQHLQANEAELATRVQHVLYAKDLIVYRLAGRAVTDPSSGPDALTWPAEIESCIEPGRLPSVALPWELAGEITPGAAAILGCKAGTPVAVGGHDGICANTGAGAIAPGHYALTLGTHCVARGVASDSKPPPGALRFYGFPPDQHVIGGNALYAGRALDWFIDQWISTDEAQRHQDFTMMAQEAAGIRPGANGLSFLPFLGGQLSPVRRPGATGSLHGLRLTHTRAHSFRAILEGVSFAIADVLDAVTQLAPVESINLTGSGVLNDTWTQMLADVTGHTTTVTDASSEGRGAAIFAAVACGDYPDLSRAIESMVKPTRLIEPGNARAYIESRERWRQLIDAER